jgi:bis(5'-nucleosidyl)-tetraphosphatase
MEQDESFGIIPLRRKNDSWEVFLVFHKHARYWGFPKGHSEQNETSEEAACRELKEETNLDLVRYLVKEPLTEQYRFTHEQRFIVKRVYYFIAEVKGTVKLQESEIGGGIWLGLQDAMNQITHPEGRTILNQVEKYLI